MIPHSNPEASASNASAWLLAPTVKVKDERLNSVPEHTSCQVHKRFPHNAFKYVASVAFQLCTQAIKSNLLNTFCLL